MNSNIVISLFDYTGVWCQPYRSAGYDVRQYDLKLGHDLLELSVESFPVMVHAVLAAPPCTDFSSSGAQYWTRKDTDGTTDKSIAMVRRTLEIVHHCRPTVWALENPVGRLNRCVPELRQYGPWYWQPYWYGDAYTKKTGLWGVYSKPIPCNVVEPLRVCSQGSWLQRLGGSSERTKELRSATPKGFAQAFFECNR